MKTWVIPGCSLIDGSGWKIWYAHAGDATYTPKEVEIWHGAERVKVSQKNESVGVPSGLGRSITIATVTLDTPMPGKTFKIRIPELADPKKTTFETDLTWQTFPTEVTDKGVSFMFVSCFWRNDDKDGYYSRAVDAAMSFEKTTKPAFKFLAGDQIYLDFPTPISPFQSHVTKVAKRYKEYWGDASYQSVLRKTPNFFLCDDHEWWNDYPEFQVHIPYTHTKARRESYGAVATEYYEAFQRKLNPGTERWYSFEMDPVSFFFADTRSARDSVKRKDKNPQFMQEDQWEALEAWQDNLKGPGILVTGMPLFQEEGDWKDHSLLNFPEDNKRLLELFSRSLRGDNKDGKRHDIVILSGDIHTGRHCVAHLSEDPNFVVHELIASPASRVGPFTSTPKPSMPPEKLLDRPATLNGKEWAVSETKYTSVENNLGIIRLFPSEKDGSKIRLEFANYLVRPHRRPAWKFLCSEPEVDFNNGKSLKLYESNQKMDIYLK